MDRTNFIDKIKLLFSEVESEDIKLAEDKPCDCKEKDCDCSDEKIEEEMADEEVEVEAPEKEECKCPEGEEDCDCEEKPEEVLEPELAEEEVVEAPEEDEMEKRLEALEKALANISESMSAIDNLSEVVSKLANSPAEEEIKLSKASNNTVKKELTTRESKLKAFAKR